MAGLIGSLAGHYCSHRYESSRSSSFYMSLPILFSPRPVRPPFIRARNGIPFSCSNSLIGPCARACARVCGTICLQRVRRMHIWKPFQGEAHCRSSVARELRRIDLFRWWMLNGKSRNIEIEFTSNGFNFPYMSPRSLDTVKSGRYL